MTGSDLHNERSARFKQLYDLSKHLTTMSTGILLLMGGMLDKLFQAPAWKSVASGAFLCFAFSLIGCVVAMFCFALYSPKTFDTEVDPTDTGTDAMAVAIVLFVLGVLLFSAFVFRNLA